ncbi:MAG: PHP domain-containing protein [Negativicutes bacterium]|nr:PHP domain-containing protein [Negativicutes bacterium]
MLRSFITDLHVHSALSPCAAVEMTPRNIVWNAAAQGIDIIAITDHNAADNVAAAMEAAKDTGVIVLPGMEVETKEEIHILVLFEKIRQLRAWQRFVDEHRLDLINDERRFGAQFIIDAEDNLVGVRPELLLAPLAAGLKEVTDKAAELGGIAIASHIDRPAYSILSQLGFIPHDISLAAVEVTRRVRPSDAERLFPAIAGRPVITASDAHTIEDLVTGPKTAFYMEEPTLKEIQMALQGLHGRKAVV